MLTVCCFQWYDPEGKCNGVYLYGPEHVARLQRMVARHLALPHRFLVVTNEPGRYRDRDIEAVRLDMTTFVPRTRYAKLMLFRRDIADLLGPRILYLDLDCVIVASLDPIVDRPEPMVLWRNPNFVYPRRSRYNTSIMLLDAGVRPDLYEAFDPARHPAEMRRLTSGTDQAWISQRCADEGPCWDASHGVYGAGRPGDIARGVGATLPANARIVFFPGPRIPDMAAVRATHPWIEAHAR